MSIYPIIRWNRLVTHYYNFITHCNLLPCYYDLLTHYIKTLSHYCNLVTCYYDLITHYYALQFFYFFYDETCYYDILIC